MKRLDPDKLYVEFRAGVTTTEPVLGRKYTLTHSDITADLFLTIGLQFAYDKVNAMRDEVLAEWRLNNGFPFLYGYVYHYIQEYAHLYATYLAEARAKVGDELFGVVKGCADISRKPCRVAIFGIQ